MNNGPVEPSADMRQLANAYHQFFVALTQEGFTVPQALQLIGTALSATIISGANDDETGDQ